MSAERESWSDKINDLLRFIDLMVKQTCRRAKYEYDTRGRYIKEDKTSIYSVDHLRRVFENPREHIYQLVKNPQKTLKGLRVENQGAPERKDTRFTKIEQKMLLDFVKKVQDLSPAQQVHWIDLNHYIYYAYRNFACENPNPNPEALSAFFICEMKCLLDRLKEEDESQVWLRIFTLLREYCIFAQWHYSQNFDEHALTKFFYYYEAMLTSAKSLIPVFLDFEKDVIYKHYKVCWIDFNTFIFIRYFYESEKVTEKISKLLEMNNSPGDSPQMFTLMSDLNKLWTKEKTRVSLLQQEGRLAENTPEAIRERKNLASHKKIVKGNFWVDRTKDLKKRNELHRLDHNLFELLNDPDFLPEGPGVNKNGQCICEECMIARYKIFLDTNDDFSAIQITDRISFCRRCKCLIKLDLFHQHICNHAENTKYHKNSLAKPHNLINFISERMDFMRIRRNSNISDMLNEKLKINKTNSVVSKLALEQYLQNKKESDGDMRNKNGRNRLFQDDLMQELGKELKLPKEKTENTSTQNCTTEQLEEIEKKMLEIRRNGHKPYPPSKQASTKEVGSKDGCGPYENSNNKNTKNCDCTYCAIFGSSTKNVQLKERLAARLNQRREKKKESASPRNLQSPRARGLTNGDFNKLKASKVESRVPLPASPSNIPSTPTDSSEYSLPSGQISDIRGLVNYIEGNSSKSKAELAKKKAAKKARQKERREQERLEAELEAKRKIEQKAVKELEKKEERKKELEKREEERKIEEAQLKKKLKKKRQAMKRQELERQKNTFEETIPAMVTIKRTPGDESGSPSVTITLKGYTPDQDKLLTTLIDKTDMEEKKEVSVTNKNIVQGKCGKKKKNAMKMNESIMSSKVVSDEAKIIAKNVKVTLAVDKNPIPIIPDPLNMIIDQQFKHQAEEIKREREPTADEIRALGNLKLPPGITITKVEGPLSNKSYLGSDTNKNSSMLGKSGVIVVDTEKLIQKKVETDISKPSKAGRRKKKKSKKNAKGIDVEQSDKPKMVTLRNPMFQPFQNPNSKSFPADESAPAAIFTRENGMVTIRSSRLQQSLDNGAPNSSNAVPFGISLMPNLVPEMPSFSSSDSEHQEQSSKSADNSSNKNSNLNAQEILSGLPGIEITKVDKKSDSNHNVDLNNGTHDAQVSIIPSNGTDFDMEFDKDDDWLYGRQRV
ncbi:reticulocyte-binding protein 2 homolog a-like isoform X2 [Sitophilus oryzae]|uniref:Reticulocyte-binding protein 2 homolog a-like isoform X2 n=1 Tax=Sitophilus oryzae TaxID=7048 RepID=A0A6J2XBI0_SITOR|nr:reticulocyte-binding protein 2 homolog a-like isoform X2 [Sitophilus oryzae]